LDTSKIKSYKEAGASKAILAPATFWHKDKVMYNGCLHHIKKQSGDWI